MTNGALLDYIRTQHPELWRNAKILLKGDTIALANGTYVFTGPCVVRWSEALNAPIAEPLPTPPQEWLDRYYGAGGAY